MITAIDFVIPANKLLDLSYLNERIRRELNLSDSAKFEFRIIKKSLDARNRHLKYNLRIQVALNESLPQKEYHLDVIDVRNKEEVHIVGAGPGGYFAALEAIQLGFKPILFERGKDVRSRRRDLKDIHQSHKINPNSNYCFGEGGAGTYSDGKLYTRSKKRGNTLKVLEWLVAFGAPSNILIEAHPHIGTNKLPKIIESIRNYIEECGGQVCFNSCLTDLSIDGGRVKSIAINNEAHYNVNNLILATGHSARDIFVLLHKNGVKIEAKNFALGVRIEHPQEIIDSIQYHGNFSCDYLPPASYSLVTQAFDRGVYSFCMCPGGIIAPCATNQNEVVTNGWSPSKRNNPFANSGIVVEIRKEDFADEHDPFVLMNFQAQIEQRCWEAAGKTQKVPAQRLLDFINNKTSIDLPKSSYQPGITSVNLNLILPDFVVKNLKIGFKKFGLKMKDYMTNDAVLHAPESRTSSPIRIPRNEVFLHHEQVINLYPCGEGAGYAGGIVSAAVDGIRCVEQIAGKKQS